MSPAGINPVVKEFPRTAWRSLGSNTWLGAFMMPRKRPIFDVVPLEAIAHLMDSRKKFSPKTGQRKILSISYDRSLLTTRGLILSAAGYQVRSLLGLEAALAEIGLNEFDLVIIGHSISLEDRNKILRRVRKLSKAPILALSKLGPEEKLDGADYQLEASEGPIALLEMVRRILDRSDGSAHDGHAHAGHAEDGGD